MAGHVRAMWVVVGVFVLAVASGPSGRAQGLGGLLERAAERGLRQYIRNALVNYERGTIAGNGPYRIGLKLPIGWIYAEGITHFEVDEHDRLLLAGHDYQGKLAVCLEISLTPFV